MFYILVSSIVAKSVGLDTSKIWIRFSLPDYYVWMLLMKWWRWWMTALLTWWEGSPGWPAWCGTWPGWLPGKKSNLRMKLQKIFLIKNSLISGMKYLSYNNYTNNCFSKLSHPNLLLLMGVCSGKEGETVRIIFEHVNHGSLYHWIHVQVRYIFELT